MGTIKIVGSSGQISLGKKFAGQTVMLDEIEAGVWIVKIGRFIPDNEKWLHKQNAFKPNSTKLIHGQRKIRPKIQTLSN